MLINSSFDVLQHKLSKCSNPVDIFCQPFQKTHPSVSKIHTQNPITGDDEVQIYSVNLFPWSYRDKNAIFNLIRRQKSYYEPPINKRQQKKKILQTFPPIFVSLFLAFVKGAHILSSISDRDRMSRVKLTTQNSSLIRNNNNFDVEPLRKYFSVNFFVCEIY